MIALLGQLGGTQQGIFTKIAVNWRPNHINITLSIGPDHKVVDAEFVERGIHFTHHVPVLLWRHILAHVLPIKPPDIMEFGADEKCVFLATTHQRSNLGQAFKGTFITFLGHVVHKDRTGIGGGDIEVGLIHV